MRVHHVERSRSKLTCDKCSATIRKGQPYRWAQAYRSRKKVRCDKLACAFRPSDLTGSDKLSRVYAAQEAAEDAISGAEDCDAFVSLCGDMATELREVADEYREAAEAMGGAGQEMEEKADNLEGWADEVESACSNLDAFVEHEGSGKDEAGQTREEWLEEARAAVQDAIGNCPL